MKRYYNYRVTLKSGIEFLAKVNAEDTEAFTDWASRVRSISHAEETGSVNRIGPHSSQKSKLAIARMTAGLTQQELADKVGVKILTYQRWEMGEFTPKAKSLIKLGEILGIDWKTLIE